MTREHTYEIVSEENYSLQIELHKRPNSHYRVMELNTNRILITTDSYLDARELFSDLIWRVRKDKKTTFDSLILFIEDMKISIDKLGKQLTDIEGRTLSIKGEK